MSRRLALAAILAAVLAAPLFGQPALAQPSPADPFNPAPAPDDVELPMPGGGRMAFRRVSVPGSEFWMHPDRRVQVGSLGHPEPDDDDVFETPRAVVISGSFPNQSGDAWEYFLGKYEVSKAQFVAVMGRGNEAEGLRALATASGNPVDAKLATMAADARTRELARPVAWLGWSAVQSFIDTYNKWCFSEASCLTRLPTMDGVPGFFRLPTEVEWEYAARGGQEALHEKPNAEIFERRTPFPEERLTEFVVAEPESQGSPRRIGSRKPSYGFYDMLGNVQELTLGVFQPEIGQGKPGGLIARGGSFRTNQKYIRTSLRSEVEIYRWDGSAMIEQRSERTGMRLAIGSNVVTTLQGRKKIVEAYRTYRKSAQATTPAGQSLLMPGVQAGDPMADALAMLNGLAAQNAALRPEVERIVTRLGSVQAKLADDVRERCQANARFARDSAERIGKATYDIADRTRAVTSLSSLANPSARTQATIESLRGVIPGIASERDAAFVNYVRFLMELRRCGQAEITAALNSLEGGAPRRSYRESVAVLREHATGPADRAWWLEQVESRLGAADVWER